MRRKKVKVNLKYAASVFETMMSRMPDDNDSDGAPIRIPWERFQLLEPYQPTLFDLDVLS